MKVTLMLCDYAAVADGKLYISGGGWTFCGPAPSPSAIAVMFQIPWTDTNRNVSFELRLISQDGEPVIQGTDGLGQPHGIKVGGEFEVGRPPGTPRGMSVSAPIALNIPPLPLTPGESYSWVLSIDGETSEDWRLGFAVRAR